VNYYFIYPDLWKDPPFFMGKSTRNCHIIYTIIDIDIDIIYPEKWWNWDLTKSGFDP